jgi:hypothetical protein
MRQCAEHPNDVIQIQKCTEKVEADSELPAYRHPCTLKERAIIKDHN